MFFTSPKKLFSFSRYSLFCNFFSLFPQFPDSKGQMKVEYIMMSSIDLHKFTDVIFGITQKLLHYIIKLGQIIYNEQRNIFELVL